MASNNVLHQLLDIFYGNYSFAEKEGKLAVVKHDCGRMFVAERKKILASACANDLAACFCLLHSQDSRCLNQYPVLKVSKSSA